MDLEARLALVREVGEEIVTEEELRALLEAKPDPVAYDGFEPSGTAHIAQGVMRAVNVNKMTRAGFRFKMFVADWHAWANDKMGGDLACGNDSARSGGGAIGAAPASATRSPHDRIALTL